MTGRSRKGGVTGADVLIRRLDWLRRSAVAQTSGAVAATAEDIRREAQETLRKATGGLPRLADEIAVEGEGAERAVIVCHPAAPFVEFGTRRLPPLPFLQPAADRARGSFRRRMEAVIARFLRGRP
jgi:HK97 gp10 family phage protein